MTSISLEKSWNPRFLYECLIANQSCIKQSKYSFIVDEFASPDVLWRLTLILLSLPASFNWQVSLEIVWIADYQVLSSASILKLWSSMYF